MAALSKSDSCPMLTPPALTGQYRDSLSFSPLLPLRGSLTLWFRPAGNAPTHTGGQMDTPLRLKPNSPIRSQTAVVAQERNGVVSRQKTEPLSH